jgi:hypothetical protein
MFTDIQLVFKKLSKNVAMPYVKLETVKSFV